MAKLRGGVLAKINVSDDLRFDQSYDAAAWRRNTKSDHDEDSSGEMLSGREYRSQEQLAKLPPSSGTGGGGGTPRQIRMSFKAASQATMSFLSARRRIEDGLKSFSKRRQSKRESICDGRMLLVEWFVVVVVMAGF